MIFHKPTRVVVVIVIVVTIATLVLYKKHHTVKTLGEGPLLSWSSCLEDRRVYCSEILVPIDYSNPSLGMEKVQVTSLQPAGGEKYSDILFINPGGPGISVRKNFSDLTKQLGISSLKNVLVVGVEPRQLVNRFGVKCSGRKEFKQVKQCLGSISLNSVSTVSEALDIEQVRMSLKVSNISIYGLSYGTVLALQYGRLFPRRTKLLLLSGAVSDTALARKSIESPTERINDGSLAANNLLKSIISCNNSFCSKFKNQNSYKVDKGLELKNYFNQCSDNSPRRTGFFQSILDTMQSSSNEEFKAVNYIKSFKDCGFTNNEYEGGNVGISSGEATLCTDSYISEKMSPPPLTKNLGFSSYFATDGLLCSGAHIGPGNLVVSPIHKNIRIALLISKNDPIAPWGNSEDIAKAVNFPIEIEFKSYSHLSASFNSCVKEKVLLLISNKDSMRGSFSCS